jgi:fatty-acyl-CoA synthase
MRPNPFASEFLRVESHERARPQRGMSYAAGATDVPLRFVTLCALLDDTVAAHGARDAAIFAASGTRWSWYDLQRRADDVAAALLALGLQPGDRIGIWAHACEEWVGTFLGAARIGAIAVAIDPACGEAELEHALNQTQCRALIAARAVASRDAAQLLAGLLPELDRPADRLRAARVPRLRQVVMLGDAPVPAAAITFRALRRLPGPAQRTRVAALGRTIDADHPAGIRFTSAPPGQAKAALHSHRSLANSALHVARSLALSERECVGVTAPLHHGIGLVLGMLGCVASGATMVIPAPAPQATLDALARQRCSRLIVRPALVESLLESHQASQLDLSSLRGGFVAGVGCTPDLLRRAADRLHLADVLTSYGTTQSNHVGLQPDAGDPLDRRAECGGRVQPHMEAKLVDADGRIVPVGAPGELCLRGYPLLSGYWNADGSLQAATDAAGWLRTGDRAVMDGAGVCRIVRGR